jgi:hypothetical protein
MSEHIYHFSTMRDREECRTLAVELAKRDGRVSEDATCEAVVMEVDSQEFRVAVRERVG